MPIEKSYVLIGDDSKILKGQTIACEKAVEYPSTFFSSTPLKKPNINIYYKDKDIKVIRNSLHQKICEGSGDVLQANAYLYKLYKDKIERNHHTWVSYGITIGTENADVNPFSMVTISEHVTGGNDLTSTIEAPVSVDKWLPYVLVFIFRVSRIVHDNYRIMLIDSVKRQAVGLPDTISLEALISSCGSWINNPDYCKIIASLDMFYYRFPKSDLSNIRIGTISSRYRECAALTNYQHLVKVVGAESMGALFEWVFNSTVKDDLFRIFKSGEELDKEFSYFPYQVDFGLVQKSAYSATTNSGLYTWGSIVCVLNRDPQSLNARLLNFNSITDVVWNAKLLGYVKSNRVNTQIFFKEQNAHDPVIMSNETSNIMTGLPTGSNPVRWFNYMKSRNFAFPDECITFFNLIKESITDPRPGTIGEYIKMNF
ncbi:nucleoprotein [jopcycgri virus 1]|uniref:Nucleoprotein n=1 Tax=jopcycgri virus 1 TaxID=2992924 RepID=A0A9E7VB18_9RHAB|nr:nucleoprotein [jopcycgri virus 1]